MEKEKNDNGTKGAMSLHLSGDIYLIRGEYDKALEYYQRSLADTEKKCGKDHYITYINLSNIGKVYVHMEKYDKALEYYQKDLAQKLKEPHKGKYPDGTAYIYDDIGNAYSNLGENEKALENYQKALSIREKDFDPNHPIVATSYNDIAWTYCLLGRYAEALPWAEKCVAACSSVPYFIDTLATTYQGLGRLEEALEQFELCLKLKIEQGSPQHTEESIHGSKLKVAQLKELMKG